MQLFASAITRKRPTRVDMAVASQNSEFLVHDEVQKYINANQVCVCTVRKSSYAQVRVVHTSELLTTIPH